MKVLKVGEFIEIVNSILKETLSGEACAVEGEVSGYRVSQGQWVSFDLKDETALVNVFMPVWSLNVPVEDGLRVRVFGTPRVYPKYGKFSLSAERIELAGEGALRKALAMLRIRLEKEGLFDPSRKRPLPKYPERIALVASKESAAYGDFIRVLGERWGGVEIDLYHVLVQGERAPQDIVRALAQAQEEGSYDVIVMTRGGGSLEELMAFNDERVVRAIHASTVPTLVAIGHERDVTLAEEAADVRGSTPTDCARRLVPDKRDVAYELSSLMETIDRSLGQRLERAHHALERATQAPATWISTRVSAFESTTRRFESSFEQWFDQLKLQLEQNLRLLSSLDPSSVLRRGYAMVTDVRGSVVTTVGRLKVHDALSVTFADGVVTTQVTAKGKMGKQETLL